MDVGEKDVDLVVPSLLMGEGRVVRSKCDEPSLTVVVSLLQVEARGVGPDDDQSALNFVESLLLVGIDVISPLSVDDRFGLPVTTSQIEYTDLAFRQNSCTRVVRETY